MKTEVQKCPFCGQECNTEERDNGDRRYFFCRNKQCVETEVSSGFMQRLNENLGLVTSANKYIRDYLGKPGYCECEGYVPANINWIPSR